VTTTLLPMLDASAPRTDAEARERLERIAERIDRDADP
jgi:hypothetical protein